MPVRSLRDGTILVADASGSGGANKVTVSLEEGNLNWTGRFPANIILDRGVLDHARLASDEPVDLSFSVMFQSLSTHASTTLYDAITKSGGASAWVSDEPNSDVYAVIVEFTVTDPAGGASEVLTFARYIPEEISFQEGDPSDTLAVSGRAVITAPAIS
jgi:hypothetical protein